MRFYDTELRTELHEQDASKVPETAIPMDDSRVVHFFKPLPDGHELTFDENGLPLITEKPEPQPVPEYIGQRVMAYPSITEQLDMQYHDKINGTTTWADAIQAVKDKYPKPE